MIQRFIEIGQGYSDIYELLEVGRNQKHRVARLLAMHTTINDKKVTSLVIVMQPTDPGKFQPLYICREGIPNPHATKNKRYELFENLAEELDRPIIEIDVKPSVLFAEIELYYQHLIGILRMNRYLPPLS
ncbi:methylthioribose kinase [Peribacillus simplex]|uniref:Methylthioribose kinase n=2 Tax=Peribacillus TaxID=2675229 RepID=A0AA90SJW0_9BACI|nr:MULTISPECIES: methylthioribose kinase [Peribacillus]MDP1417848.1 methylthioribose kinase [Peribacillus simplex]MDP1450686.1 methylthioribose kinase [Peribacillus frigoritolerans]